MGMCVYVCMYYVCMYVCVCVYVCIYVLCMYVCMYVCVCVFFLLLLHAPLLGVILHAYYNIYRHYKQYLYNVLFYNFSGVWQLAV